MTVGCVASIDPFTGSNLGAQSQAGALALRLALRVGILPRQVKPRALGWVWMP